MSEAPLLQRTLYEDPGLIAARLPLGEELGALHPGGCFPLLEDPSRSARACIIGMFVLRPAHAPWTEPLLDATGLPESIYRASGWCFNVKGTHGGALIAAGNPLDAYRLALQYGATDAVIVASDTVAKEGVAHGSTRGYLWQPYGPPAWPQLAGADPDLLGKILRQRAKWQRLGLLSQRRYPAQIVVSQSGRRKDGMPDLLDAAIFSHKHPDGSPIEVYLLSSQAGAQRLRDRARARGTTLRIDHEILALSPRGEPEVLDVAAVPEMLRAHLDIRIADHDGGAIVMSKFAEAGALAQLNLTLMRGRSVREVLASTDRLEAARREALLESFDDRAQLFFSGDHRLPRTLRPAYVIGNDGEGVVVTLDLRGARGF
ncbi:MAG: hypothetical protein HY899_04985 [Deltaproteobacteria bacterium]|nr:hypothetical protein [Deltaproteobacteria bacterium]